MAAHSSDDRHEGSKRKCSFIVQLEKYHQRFRNLNAEIARYRMLMLYIGTAQDSQVLRADLTSTRRGLLNAVVRSRMEILKILANCCGAGKRPHQSCRDSQNAAHLFVLSLEYLVFHLQKSVTLLQNCGQADSQHAIRTGLKEVYMLKGRNSIVPLTVGNVTTCNSNLVADQRSIEDIKKDIAYMRVVEKEVSTLYSNVKCSRECVRIGKEELDEQSTAASTTAQFIVHPIMRTQSGWPHSSQCLCLVCTIMLIAIGVMIVVVVIMVFSN